MNSVRFKTGFVHCALLWCHCSFLLPPIVNDSADAVDQSSYAGTVPPITVFISPTMLSTTYRCVKVTACNENNNSNRSIDSKTAIARRHYSDDDTRHRSNDEGMWPHSNDDTRHHYNDDGTGHHSDDGTVSTPAMAWWWSMNNDKKKLDGYSMQYRSSTFGALDKGERNRELYMATHQ